MRDDGQGQTPPDCGVSRPRTGGRDEQRLPVHRSVGVRELSLGVFARTRVGVCSRLGTLAVIFCDHAGRASTVRARVPRRRGAADVNRFHAPGERLRSNCGDRPRECREQRPNFAAKRLERGPHDARSPPATSLPQRLLHPTADTRSWSIGGCWRIGCSRGSLGVIGRPVSVAGAL